MGMRCLVWLGLRPGLPVLEQERLAAALGLTLEALQQRVLARAPLIVRATLDARHAAELAARLRAQGAELLECADNLPRVWLRQGTHTAGPVPRDALAQLARTGDFWCEVGQSHWQRWPPAAPPPLPRAAAGRSTPPPLPAAGPGRAPLDRWARFSAWLGAFAWLPPIAPAALLGGLLSGYHLLRHPVRRGRGHASFALLAGLLFSALWWHWLHATPAPPDRGQLHSQLMPLPRTIGQARATASCASAVTAGDSEAAQLLAGGRGLTGRSDTRGDTRVIEAVNHWHADCSPAQYQLYVFHQGVLLGTALPDDPSGLAPCVQSFALRDERHLDLRVGGCPGAISACRRGPASYQLTLVSGPAGWRLQGQPASGSDDASRLAGDYPIDPFGRRHQGTVWLTVQLGPGGHARAVQVSRSSGYAELDAAAQARVWQWCFPQRQANGRPLASVRVPVNFRLLPAGPPPDGR